MSRSSWRSFAVFAVAVVNEVATGDLAGIGLLIQSTRAIPRPGSGDDGGIVGASLDTESAIVARLLPGPIYGDRARQG